MVAIDGEWTCPVHGAGAARDNLDADPTAYRDVVSFDEPSDPGLRHRPPAAVLAVPGQLQIQDSRGSKTAVDPKTLQAMVEP